MDTVRYIRSHPRWVLGVALLVFVLAHAPYIFAPPNGYHQWRESDTAAVILNYYQEDANPLNPRINQRGDASGITGMELPLYNYAAAGLYFVFGPHHFLARGLTLAMSCLCLVFAFYIGRRLLDELYGALVAWAMAFSPLVFFYSGKIMPDITMLALMLAAVIVYLKYLDSGRLSHWCASLVLITVAAMIKPLVLCVGLIWLAWWWRQPRRKWTQLGLLAIYMTVATAAMLAWLAYARYVNEMNHSPGFYLGENAGAFYQFLFSPQFLKKLLAQWPWELWIGWTMVPAFIWGLVQLRTARQAGRLALWWLVGAYVVFALTAQHSASHDYYPLIIVPAVALITAHGLYQMVSGKRWMQVAGLVLLLIAPIGAWVRVANRYSDVPEFDQIRADTEAAIARDELVMVEDPTTAIRLYQLNRHGWPLRHGIEADEVGEKITRGARFLITEEPITHYDSSVSQLVEDQPLRIGPLYAWPIREID